MASRKGEDGEGAPASAAPGRPLHGRIADDLGVAILTGVHPPGATLPNEIEASEGLKVSRTAYREAIRMLAAKGLVESRPKSGTRVTPRERWNLLDPDVLRWMFAREPSEAFVRGLFELREVVEPAAAALAARRRTAHQLSRMGHALEEMARHGLATPQGRTADQAFHEEILRAAANEPLLSLAASISAAVRWTTVFKHRKHRLPRDPMPDHRRVYAAIADADPDRAAAAMRELIRLALQDTRQSLG